jgi:hypothetical protein
MQNWIEFLAGIYFSIGKYGVLGPWLMDHGQCRSMVDRGQGIGGGSPELGLAATTGHDGLPRGWQCKEGDAT